MASIGLPPPPINDAPGSFTWLEWYRQLRSYVSTSGSVPWYIINFAGSNITDIATRLHNNLQGLQGGTSGEMYHLTAAQYSALTAGPHNNLSGLQGGTSGEYYHLTANETRNARNTIEYITPATGFSQTITNTTTFLVIEPTGTLATGTVIMPASPVDGQVVTLTTTQTITTLTHNPNTGQTLKGALTTITANSNAAWIYKTSTTTWYRVS
jgi:hypothetical protein